MRSTLWVVLVFGCGSDAAKVSDGAVSIDVRPIDAKLDAPADAPPVIAGSTHRFVMDHELLPATTADVMAYGLDLDNDNVVDNALGQVVATLGSSGLDTQPAVTHAIDTGSVITLLNLDADDLTTESAAGFTLYSGANPQPPACTSSADTTCRHHLTGTATFDVATTSAHDMPLTGAIAANALTAGPGTLHFPITIFGGTASVELIGARVKLTSITDQAATGVIAGAISQTEVDTKLIPAIAAGATAQIALDCTALTSPPTCGCAAGSSGATFISLLDSNHDCAVTSAEVQGNQIITSLLAPDVTIGTVHALSFGAHITAVHATFTP